MSSVNTNPSANDMLDAAVAWLSDRLPRAWEVGPSLRSEPQTAQSGGMDAAIELRSPNGTAATIIVEARPSLSPRDVDRLLGSVGRSLRSFASHVPILVVAPWLSPRTRGLLEEQGLNYLDLTGTALVQLDNPALYLQAEGATKNPFPAPRAKAGLRGAKAGRLVRLLADVQPPYGVRELAASAGLAPGYVSRLLDSLDDDALVERSERGGVEDVDTIPLLRRWAEDYDVFSPKRSFSYLAPDGAKALLTRLASASKQTAVTGSFAAVRLAPIAAPSLLVAYTDAPDEVADSLDLMPADRGANAVLLAPFDPVVWDRTTQEDGVRYVAPSQAAVDCLTGNGRMPAEGEALLDWMEASEKNWRLTTLPPPGSDDGR